MPQQKPKPTRQLNPKTKLLKLRPTGGMYKLHKATKLLNLKPTGGNVQANSNNEAAQANDVQGREVSMVSVPASNFHINIAS